MEENKILIKLHAIKKSIPKISKDGTNPFFNGSKYLTLEKIVGVLTPILEENNTVLYHSQEENRLFTCLFDIESGQELKTSYPINDTLVDQKIGSALTYGRRYSICLMFGIVADEDDDGNKAASKEKPKEEGKKQEEKKDTNATPSDSKMDKSLTKLQGEVYTALKSKTPEVEMNNINIRWNKAKNLLPSPEVFKKGESYIKTICEKNNFELKDVKK